MKIRRDRGTAAAVVLACAVLVAVSGDAAAWTPHDPVSAAVRPAAPTAPAAPTSPAARGAAPLEGVVVVLDAGHNGANAAHLSRIRRQVDAGNGLRKACNSTGTATDDGYPEHAYTFDVVRRLTAVLRERGAVVETTRSDDSGVGPCVDERAAVGNRAQADVVLSVHADGNRSPGARGFHVIVSDQMAGGVAVAARSRKLAEAVRDAFADGTGMPPARYVAGGVGVHVRRDLGGLNLARQPAVMIETGNMRDRKDAALLRSSTFRRREALALAEGLQAFLGR